MHTMKESTLRPTGSIFMQTTNALDRKTQEVVAFESCWLRLKAACVVLSISRFPTLAGCFDHVRLPECLADSIFVLLSS